MKIICIVVDSSVISIYNDLRILTCLSKIIDVYYDKFGFNGGNVGGDTPVHLLLRLTYLNLCNLCSYKFIY